MNIQCEVTETESVGYGTLVYNFPPQQINKPLP